MKHSKRVIFSTLSILPLAACNATVADNTKNTSDQVTSTVTIDLSANDQNTGYDQQSVEKITFKDDSIAADGANLNVSGSTLTISGAGDYLVSGKLNDGEIIIAADKEDVVHLIFDGVDLKNADGSALVVLNADKVIITLAEGSTNTITDGETYAKTSDSDPDAAIYAKDDLTINGPGSLNITSASQNGIHGTDDVIILNSTVSVTSDKDGIKGKDAVILQDADITVSASNDGIQSTNDTEQGKGYIAIDGGSIDITAGLDGIQAETQVLIVDGDLSITSGRYASSDQSGKGIKAVLDLTIEGGTIDVYALTDDTLHSNGTLTISGGTLALDSGDDGIHADNAITINGGDILISQSYEGIESAKIILNDGTIRVNSSDDGINGSSGSSSSPQGGAMQDDGSEVIINGAYVYLNALGDGLDSNGTISMSSGTVVIFGPTANNNGAIDYNGSFTLSGGTLLAVGSSGMAEQATKADINTVMVNLSTTLQSGTLVSIVDSNNNLVVAFETIKSANSIVFASESLAKGSYTVYSGGSLNGTLSDHAAFSGATSGGTKLTEFTISSSITTSGTASGGPGGGGNRPPKP